MKGYLIFDFYLISSFCFRNRDILLQKLTRSHEKLQKELIFVKKDNTHLRNQLDLKQISCSIVPRCSTSLPIDCDNFSSVPSVGLLPAIARNPAEARKGRKWKSSSTTRRDAKRRAFFIRKQFPSSMLDNTQRFQPF